MTVLRKSGSFNVSGILLAGFFLFLPAFTNAAASLYLSPPSGTFSVGSTFTVGIYLNTGGQAINAVEADLQFQPNKLQIVSPNTGKSLIQIWVNQPSYDNKNGTLRFQGTIPTPGINTNSGLISSLTFRVKDTGTATLKFSDSSKILLNDGRGTDILGQTTDGIYYFTLPPPAGPIVTSPTNPDQNEWYNNRSIVFEWAAPPDIQGYSYILNQDPVAEPDEISEGTKTRVVYNDLAEGIYYFHIKGLRQGSWGGVTDYEVKIDNTPPADFKINFSPGERTSNHRPLIDFATTDEMSGIDHYELKIIPLDFPQAVLPQNATPFFFEVAPPYYSKNLDFGSYDVVVRAYDTAGNYREVKSRLTIIQPIFEFIYSEGLRIGGTYTLSWPDFAIALLIILAFLIYIARRVWRARWEIEERIFHGAAKHPGIARKLEALRAKQKEYLPKGEADGKKLLILFLFFALGLSFVAGKVNAAQDAADQNVTLEPPVVTLFPKAISNDEILYIGGRAGAPRAKILIYLQNLESGSTLSEVAVTDDKGAWFYSFPQFLNSGDYIVWTQLQIRSDLSPPSSRMDLTVAKAAVQIGGSRLSYQDFYLILFILFLAAFLGLLIFIVYHGHHLRRGRRHLKVLVDEAEESIRRGFAILRHDIEAELEIIRKAKLGKELSREEKEREGKLIKDLELVSRYIGKEVWKIENEAEDKGK